MTNATQGFWLVNSMPHWPNQRSVGPGPFPDFTYGQSLMCVTLNTKNIDIAAANLIVGKPYVYDKANVPKFVDTMPNFASWLSGTKTSVTSVTSKIESLSGRVFHQLEKSGSWGKDLWDDLAAPYFNTAFSVETWRSGSGGRMGSICGDNITKVTDYEVYEVSTMRMPDGVSWTGTQDHSKWASAKPSVSYGKKDGVLMDSKVVCVGDNNRMCSQESRGGGALCFEDTDLWTAFNATISTYEDCYAYNPCTGSSTKCYWCPVSYY